MTTRTALASLEYLRVTVTPAPDDDPTSLPVDFALPAAGQSPATWHGANWEGGGPPYVAALLIGPDDLGSDLELPVGAYDVWVRITDTNETPAFLADRLVVFADVTTFAGVSDMADTMRADIDPEDAQANQALLAATELVRAYTRQTLSLVTDDVVTMDAAWRDSLVLPELPVDPDTGVSEVVTIDVDGTETTLDPSEYFVTAAGILKRTATSWASWSGYAYWPWCQRVRVTYTHGFETIPEAIRQATAAIAARLYRANAPATDTQATAGVAEVSETIGSYSYDTKYDTATTAQATVAVDNSGLTVTEQLLLGRYRQVAV